MNIVSDLMGKDVTVKYRRYDWSKSDEHWSIWMSGIVRAVSCEAPMAFHLLIEVRRSGYHPLVYENGEVGALTAISLVPGFYPEVQIAVFMGAGDQA